MYWLKDALLLFFAVQYLIPFRVQLNFQPYRRHAFTLRRKAWFAKNFTNPDEYGLTTAANNQLLRQ